MLGAKDIFFVVFSYLHVVDLIYLRRVCKGFNQLVKDSDVWKDCITQLIQTFIDFYPQQKELILSLDPSNQISYPKFYIADTNLVFDRLFINKHRRPVASNSNNQISPKFYDVYFNIKSELVEKVSLDLNFYKLFRNFETACAFNVLDIKYREAFRNLFKKVQPDAYFKYYDTLLSATNLRKAYPIVIEFKLFNFEISINQFGFIYNNRYYSGDQIFNEISALSDLPCKVLGTNILRYIAFLGMMFQDFK